MNPLISIILPVYNVEKYLKECLDSILQQTYPHLQIICVDDGSTDSSGTILDEYAKNDNRILIIHQANGGVGKAFNAGYARATGTYIGYVEPDDFLEKNMYEKLLEMIEKDGSDIARCNFVSFDNIDRKEAPSENTLTTQYAHLSPINPIECEDIFLFHPAIWSNLYKKSLLDDNNIRFTETPGASFQDGPFSFKVFSCAQKVSLIDTDLYHYRLHSNQSTRSVKVWFYEKTFENVGIFINQIKDAKLAKKLSLIRHRTFLYVSAHALLVLSKEEIPKMCQFIYDTIHAIPDSEIQYICRTRTEKIFYFIFRHNLTYMFYLSLKPISFFQEGNYKTRKIVRFFIKLLG